MNSISVGDPLRSLLFALPCPAQQVEADTDRETCTELCAMAMGQASMGAANLL